MGGVWGYLGRFLGGTNLEKPTECRQNINDAFHVEEFAFYIALPTSSTASDYRVATYPNDTVLGAGNFQQYFNLYTSYMQISVNNVTILPRYDIQKHYYCPQTQQTARPQQALQSSVAEQVSVKITKALQAGQDRITIRLNPAELGRVEVKMELTFDGRTTAIVTAENRDTLDILRRDSAELQKALQESGLQLGDGDLTFNLRGDESNMAEENDAIPRLRVDDHVFLCLTPFLE